ncbi:hypothetical protein TNCV_4347681 [Trichonephila clavipes]|nr:hypothetical protein TNCV_4347681 [Trichonephila clavipes]
MDAETATVLRGRAKAALTRTINFIDKNDQTFDKNDIRNKLEKLELTYTEFDKADAALPIESSEMEEFETKYYETKSQATEYLRKFILADEDQKYQQILWRNNSSESIRTYKLKTVTYGLASASFLATRCIKQIALDDKDNPNLSSFTGRYLYG